MTNASRAAVDLEAFARDLQQQKGAAPAAGGAKGDPLAELARIVGQDDPFRALLAARDERRGGAEAPAASAARPPEQAAPPQPGTSWNGRVEPHFIPEAPRDTPADAFDQYLASVERSHGAEAEFEAAPEAEGVHAGRDLKRARPRRRLLTVGAGVAVVVVAVTGALTYKGLHRSGAGGVPLVQADPSPLKVAPKVADGVEIPDQNRQIYEPKAKDTQIRIVNREEQPLDVAQAARAAQQAAGQTGSTATPGSALDVFGEPRRVRTVSVKPDTPAPPRETQAEAVPSPIPTMSLPTEEPAPRSRSLRQATATPEQAAPPAAPVQTAAIRPSLPAAPPAPAPAKAPQRMAAVAPEAAVPAEEPAVSNAAVGGFSVQLGVRGSAREAQAAFREMQGKYSQLAGKPELIRQAEVNGKTIFRVRVGPLEKGEATSLCNALQGAGGQCFVAKN